MAEDIILKVRNLKVELNGEKIIKNLSFDVGIFYNFRTEWGG